MSEPERFEFHILRARLQGEISSEAAFNELYQMYAPIVRGWIAMNFRGDEKEDLFQDVWSIFYRRWQQWKFRAEMDTVEARPVISFLYRTFCLVLKGYRRRAALVHESLEASEASDRQQGEKKLLERIETLHCLSTASRICSSEEMDVILAKMAGVPAREIARTMSVTESVVDHRFRNALTRVRKELSEKGQRGRLSQ
jgi:RNA polymerase sigma factor (sigma-70 family)